MSVGRSFNKIFWEKLFSLLWSDGIKVDTHVLECPTGTSSLVEFLMEGHPSLPASKTGYTGVIERAPARHAALEKLIEKMFKAAKEETVIVDDEVTKISKDTKDDLTQFLEMQRPGVKPKDKPTWPPKALLADPRGPFPDQSAVRKSLTRAASATQEVDANLPDSLHLLSEMLQYNVVVVPSLVTSGLCLVPTVNFEPGDKVMQICRKWSPASMISGNCRAIVADFERQGVVQTSLALPLSDDRDILQHLHIYTGSDAPADVAVLQAEWIFSTSSDPVLCLTTEEKLSAFSCELGICFAVRSPARKSARRKKASLNTCILL